MVEYRFLISSSCDINYEFYFIYFGDHYISDIELAILLDMELDEYTKLAKGFNAIQEDNGLIFINYTDIKTFADYLNETYLFILKLTGKI